MKGDAFYSNYLRLARDFYQKDFSKCHINSYKDTECKQAGDL